MDLMSFINCRVESSCRQPSGLGSIQFLGERSPISVLQNGFQFLAGYRISFLTVVVINTVNNSFEGILFSLLADLMNRLDDTHLPGHVESFNLDLIVNVSLLDCPNVKCS